MKYWAYLAAKLAVAGGVLFALWTAIVHLLPADQPYRLVIANHHESGHIARFGGNLGFTSAAMVFALICTGVAFLIIQDQRYRCRTCLRRLRSPISAGSWPNSFLLGRPRREYICIWGHGTLKVPEEKVTGSGSPDWQPHGDDILKELEESARK